MEKRTHFPLRRPDRVLLRFAGDGAATAFFAEDADGSGGGVRSREARGSGASSRRLSTLSRSRDRPPEALTTRAPWTRSSSSLDDSLSRGSLLRRRLGGSAA